MTEPSQVPTPSGHAIVRIPPGLYHSYSLVVHAKRLMGLSCARHRTFFLMRVMRALQAGRITGKLHVTAAGKRDGVGAQALAQLSAIAFARAYGLAYHHTPFQTLAHAEEPMEKWIQSWNDLLDLRGDFPLASESGLEPVDLETYAMTPVLWSQDRLLTVRHYHTFYKLAPELVPPAVRGIRDRYWSRRPAPESDSGAVRVRVHVRRGDVRIGDKDTGHRFTPNAPILNSIRSIAAAIGSLGLEADIELHSLGTPEEFAEFNSVPGLRLMLSRPARETFESLTHADVLLVARSDFSHVAAIYSHAIVLCDPRHRAPLPGWLAIDPRTGSIDSRLLVSRLSDRRGG